MEYFQQNFEYDPHDHHTFTPMDVELPGPDMRRRIMRFVRHMDDHSFIKAFARGGSRADGSKRIACVDGRGWHGPWTVHREHLTVRVQYQSKDETYAKDRWAERTYMTFHVNEDWSETGVEVQEVGGFRGKRRVWRAREMVEYRPV